MWRLYFTALLARILHQPLLYSIRFIPALQARTDKRGRTISDFESLGEAIAYLADLSNRKEKVHGHYYIAVEARSQGYGHIGAGQLQGDKRQVDAFVQVANGQDVLAAATVAGSLLGLNDSPANIARRLHEGLPGAAQPERHVEAQGEASDSEAGRATEAGDTGGQAARYNALAQSNEPVASVGFLPDVEGGKSTTGAPKVDLSDLGG